MVEDVEREAPRVSFDIRLEEVVPSLKELPSMVQLNAWKLGELVLFVFGDESIVDSACHKDRGQANRTSHELVVFAGNGMEDREIETRHGVGSEEG